MSEKAADRERDAAAGGSVRHVIVGLWLILVRMSASGPRLGIETDVRNDIRKTPIARRHSRLGFLICGTDRIRTLSLLELGEELGIAHERRMPMASRHRDRFDCYISLFSYVCGPRSLSLGDARFAAVRSAASLGPQALSEQVCQRTTIGELASERNRRDGPPPSVGATQTSDAADEGRWMA